ncbi:MULTISPECIES: transposase [Rhodococcus]|uniref:transposase n=1 Tax=Rhodococcus TaxID=1827 RepID=UPI0034645C16
MRVSPIEASSGKHIRHCLNRGGDRHANNALWRIAMIPPIATCDSAPTSRVGQWNGIDGEDPAMPQTSHCP